MNRNSKKRYLPDFQDSEQKAERIAGYDIARGLALSFMVIINFKCFFSDSESGPVWLFRLVEKCEGRAAVTFMVLAGVGISLLCKRALLANDQVHIKNIKKMLLNRAFFFIAVGLIFRYSWEADILHFYGVYLIIATFFLNTSDQRLLLAAFFASTAFYILLLFFDYGTFQDGDTSYYAGMANIGMIIRSLLFDGFYPVFPWIASIFVGMWLGRQDPCNAVFRKKIIVSSVCIIIIAEYLSFYLNQILLVTENFEIGQGVIISYETVPEKTNQWIDIW